MNSEENGRQRRLYYSILFLCAAAFIAIGAVQFKYINAFAATWDAVDFSLALDRYDLRAMQPHFPGYPYFILGGDLIHTWMNDPTASLTLFNALLFMSGVYPLYRLACGIAGKGVSRTFSLLAAMLVYTSPFLLVTVNQPMSEGAALAIMCWYLWSLQLALAKGSSTWLPILPLFLLGFLLGIRLSYIPLGVGVLFLFYKKWRTKEYGWRDIILYTVLTALFQLLWVLAVALTEGGMESFLALAFGFTSGHFNDWGGTAASATAPFYERLWTLIAHNLVWTSLMGRSLIVGAFLLLAVGITLLKFSKQAFLQNTTSQFLLWVGSFYFLWALFAQNVDKPRHIVPAALILLLILFSHLMRRGGRIAIYLGLALLVVQSFSAANDVKKQATETPATYQLAHYVDDYSKPAIVYTWEETRVLKNLGASVLHKRVFTYEVFHQDAKLYKGRTILLTDKVIKGFEAQGISLKGKVKKVKTFTSSSLFEPVYHKVVLYEWKGQ